MSYDERNRLSSALFDWRLRSQAMRWVWYKGKGYSGAACDAFYDDLIAAHEGLAR